MAELKNEPGSGPSPGRQWFEARIRRLDDLYGSLDQVPLTDDGETRAELQHAIDEFCDDVRVAAANAGRLNGNERGMLRKLFSAGLEAITTVLHSRPLTSEEANQAISKLWMLRDELLPLREKIVGIDDDAFPEVDSLQTKLKAMSQGMAALEKRSALLDRERESLLRELERARTAAQASADAYQQKAKQESEAILRRTRDTVSEESMPKIREQFEKAVQDLQQSKVLWGRLSIAAVLAFGLGFWLILHYSPSKGTTGAMIYAALWRLGVLGLLAGLVAFVLRIYRAHVHMVHQYRHRLRISTVINSLIDSAISDEQRDHILAILVQSLAEFGDSGLTERGSGSLMVVQNSPLPIARWPRDESR